MRLKSNKVARFIRQKRLEKTTTQLAMAKFLSVTDKPGVTAQIISNIERGLVQLPVAWLPLVAQFFGVEQDELLNLMAEDYKENIKAALV